LAACRYNEGQRFGKHIDESQSLEDGTVTGYTLLVYLNGRGGSSRKLGAKAAGAGMGHDLEGGETVFYDDRGGLLQSVAPRAGMALLHLHGDDCFEHEGATVIRGVKYVLRSDVTFKFL
jgi:hypothetical protein